jgi:hypothetical protein
MFKHKLGAKAQTKVSGFEGIILSRSKCLYGCNRYYVLPRADNDMKIPDGYWFDEDDITVIGEGIKADKKDTGGPMSKIC